MALVRLLRGDWFGHPLHPALTDVPVGAWTAALVFDTASFIALRPARWAADAATAVGLAAAAPTVLTGMSDLMTRTRGESRMIACLHGCVQCMALLGYAGSLAARLGGRRGTAIALSTSSYGLMAVGAWLGGQLVFRYGAGVSQVSRDPGGAASGIVVAATR